MAGKLPYMAFYPGDWMKDPALRSVSSAARGLWADCLCLMWESPKRGYLVHPSGRAVTNEQIARMTGNSPPDAQQMLDELEACGVPSRTAEGVLFSRRMVRDQKKRAKCSEAGKRGGRPPSKKRQQKGHERVSERDSKGSVKGNAKGSLEIENDITPMSEGHKGGASAIPTVDDVRAYCFERGNQINPEQFVDYYAARGWKLNGKAMKDWKACVRTWERNDAGRTNTTRRNPSLRHAEDAEADWLVADDTGAA